MSRRDDVAAHTAPPAFKRGDRVKVTDGNAPFCGSTGVVTRRGAGMPSGPYSVWMVRLDGLNSEVAHYEKELSRV